VKTKSLLAWLFALAVSFVALAAPAAQADYFLKLEGVEGESKESRHSGWIEIHSLAFPPAAGVRDVAHGQPTGKRQFSQFVIVKKVDKSTPLLKQSVARANIHPKVVLELVQSDGTSYRYTFTDVLIANVALVNPKPGDAPTESITFNYGQLVIEYKEQKSDWRKAELRDVRAPKPLEIAPPANSAR
jgi:type VI secretion system secreted protein Hcp